MIMCACIAAIINCVCCYCVAMISSWPAYIAQHSLCIEMPYTGNCALMYEQSATRQDGPSYRTTTIGAARQDPAARTAAPPARPWALGGIKIAVA